MANSCPDMEPVLTAYRNGRRVDEAWSIDRAASECRGPEVFVWIDLPEPDEELLARLQKAFGLHPLAIEDAIHGRQRTKIDQYDGFFALVAYAARPDPDRVDLHEITACVARDYAITVRHDGADGLASLRDRLDQASAQIQQFGGGFFAYALLDEVVDGYFVAVDALQDRMEALEEHLVYGPQAGSAGGLEPAFAARRDVILFRRAAAPMREVLNVLQRRDEAVLAADVDAYLRDLYDHVVRVTEDLDTMHDLISAALEAHLSVISNNMNEVVLKVSAWAAIIALPTVIASIYGMNFERMPELHWHFGYPYALGLMAASSLGLYAYFKRRRWL